MKKLTKTSFIGFTLTFLLVGSLEAVSAASMRPEPNAQSESHAISLEGSVMNFTPAAESAQTVLEGQTQSGQESYLREHLASDRDTEPWPYAVSSSGTKSDLAFNSGPGQSDFLRLGEMIPDMEIDPANFAQNVLVLEPDREYGVFLGFANQGATIESLEAMVILPKRVRAQKERRVMANYVSRDQDQALSFDDLILLSQEDLRLQLAADSAFVMFFGENATFRSVRVNDWSEKYRGLAVGSAQLGDLATGEGGMIFRFQTKKLKASAAKAQNSPNQPQKPAPESGLNQTTRTTIAIVLLGACGLCIFLVYLRHRRRKHPGMDLGAAYDRAIDEFEFNQRHKRKRKKS